MGDLRLVLGATSDLGVELLRRMLAEPSCPVVIAHGHATMSRVAALQHEFGAERVVAMPADLTDRSSVASLVEAVAATYGQPSHVVHLPALPLRYERFIKFDVEHFRRDLSIQVEAAAAILARLLPEMAKLPRAKVVFVGSSVTRGAPPKLLSMYTVVKHAQLGLMKALASEYSGTNVTINMVSPSMVETRFLDRVPRMVIDGVAKQHPRHRNASPSDVVGAIQYLLSPASDYVSGVELPVTGGAIG